MTPLDLTALTEVLVVVWLAAFICALAELLTHKYQGRMPVRPLVLASRWVSFGCMLSIFGIAQTANNLGLISYRLYLFTLLMAALAVGGAGLASRLAPPAKVRSES